MPIFASRNYSPGDVLYTETPFVWILPKDLNDEWCQSCCRRSLNLRMCKQCLAVKYCDKSCQTKDWRQHRLECKQMVNLPVKDNYDFVRLIGRVILKIKGKNWKHFKYSVLGTEVNFDEIDPNYKEMTENTFLNLMYKELKEDLTRFIGAENMPKDIDCLKIVGKVVSNTYWRVDKIISPICFFIGFSIFEEECIANSSFSLSNKGLKVWASKHIKKGSDKITIGKSGFLNDLKMLSLFNGIVRQPCKCTNCSLPYGESVLTKILDEKNAFSVIKTTEAVLKSAEVLPIIVNRKLELAANEVLAQHQGVLGRTNILHLQLLAFRYLVIGGRAGEIKGNLEDLENIMRSVFGEFHSDMLQIYKNLALVNFHLLNDHQGSMYLAKADQLERLLYFP